MKPILPAALCCAALLAGMSGAWSQTAPRPAPPKPAAPARQVPQLPSALPAADGEQMLAASQVYYGELQCEYQTQLRLSKHPRFDGYVFAEWAGRNGIFKPIRSTTGALRMEQLDGAVLVLQIPTKTMIMDVRAGRRLADGCQHDEQRKEAATAAAEDNKLGMNAPGQVSVKGTPAGTPPK